MANVGSGSRVAERRPAKFDWVCRIREAARASLRHSKPTHRLPTILVSQRANRHPGEVVSGIMTVWSRFPETASLAGEPGSGAAKHSRDLLLPIPLGSLRENILEGSVHRVWWLYCHERFFPHEALFPTRPAHVKNSIEHPFSPWRCRARSTDDDLLVAKGTFPPFDGYFVQFPMEPRVSLDQNFA